MARARFSEITVKSLLVFLPNFHAVRGSLYQGHI